SDYSLVVLNEVRKIPSALIEEIKNFVQNGGNLYIVPSMEVGAEVYQPLLNALSIGSLGEIKTNNQNVVDINLQEPIVTIAFEKIPHNIDLPKVFKYWTITSSYKVAEGSILKMDNGRSFLQKYQLGDGWVYLQASSLDVRDNDFASKVIFAPLVYNFAVV